MSNCPAGKYHIHSHFVDLLIDLDFKDRPQDYEKSLFVARIIDIPIDKKFARG